MKAIAEPDAGSRGFTLLEVVVALGILVMFLVPILGAVVGGMRMVDKIERRSIALRLAQDRMAEIEMLQFPEGEGVEDGEFDDAYEGYRWEAEYVKTPMLELIENTMGVKALEVHLRVYWEERGAEQMIEVSSLLLE